MERNVQIITIGESEHMDNHSLSRISDEEFEHSIYLFIHAFLKFRQANIIPKEIYDLHQKLLLIDHEAKQWERFYCFF